MSPTEAEIAWAAGLFEGEGCFSVHGRVGKYGRRHGRAILATADRDVIDRFHDLLGVGRIYLRKHKDRKDLFCWQTTRADEFEHVVAVLGPWLGERRLARASEILALMSLPRGKSGGQRKADSPVKSGAGG